MMDSEIEQRELIVHYAGTTCDIDCKKNAESGKMEHSDECMRNAFAVGSYFQATIRRQEGGRIKRA